MREIVNSLKLGEQLRRQSVDTLGIVSLARPPQEESVTADSLRASSAVADSLHAESAKEVTIDSDQLGETLKNNIRELLERATTTRRQTLAARPLGGSGKGRGKGKGRGGGPK